jgi:Zn-dependent protease
MLGRSINLFRIRGIMISVHLFFLPLLAYVGYEGWEKAAAPGLYSYVAIFLLVFCCVVLHELGHSFMAMRFGVRVRRILLMPIGGMAEFDSIPRKPVHELLITLAGPAVNFVIAALLWTVVKFPSGWDDVAIPVTISDLERILFFANIVMGLFNLIPAFPMDGGRILRALLALKLPYLRATFWAVMVARVLALPALAAVLYFGFTADQDGSGYLLVRVGLIVFLLYAGEAEYRGVKRRAREEAHWKAALLQHSGLSTAEEPPVLNSQL